MGILFSATTKAQLLDEKNVTVTMELQPILQLNMTTPDHIEFIFDDIREYYAGIIKYGATTLKVSSSVSWDLYAVGTSQLMMGAGTAYWDKAQLYSAGAGSSVSNLPLSALELHQYANNTATTGATGDYEDYSGIFQNANTATGQNCIYYSQTPYIPPTTANKYISGESGTGLGKSIVGGSYLTTTVAAGSFSAYMYTIDYRIRPGLPAVFPFAGTNASVTEQITAGSYATPGVYTMDVKYVLVEDQ